MSAQALTVGILTLGCKVNQYESEAISEAFLARGYRVLPFSENCDAYVINTCTVTAESDRKCRQMIRRAIHRNPKAYILITGCLGQTDPDQLASIKGVDYICGNAQKLSVVDAADELFEQGHKNASPKIIHTAPEAHGFEPMCISGFDRTRVYIKIQDGCENRCAYCIIPTARGKIRSKVPEDVLDEVRAFVAKGCPEIVLTGIETASYGRDLADCTLADLLCLVDRIPGIGQVRLGSLDPSLIKQFFVDRIAPLSCLAPHFHLSMQSGSDGVLARMRRKYNTRMALEAMERLRAAIPDVQFTTDMIAGFPGETEEEFAQTLDFIRRAKFLMIHAFPYSRRSGTEADTMPGQIDESIKHDRVRRIMELQTEIQSEILSKQVGKTCSVLFETYENGIAVGHTPSFVEVSCQTDAPIRSEIRQVKITSVRDGKCIGALIDT